MNQALYDLFIARLDTVPGMFPVQRENSNFDPAGKPFARATLIRTRPRAITKGRIGQDLHTGLLQVDLFKPIGGGTSDINAIADAVIAAFPRGLMLAADELRIHILMAYRETGGRGLNEKYHSVPVAVEWVMVRPAVSE